MRRALRLTVALLATLTLAAGTPAAAKPATLRSGQPLSYAPAPADNPLKGFMPYAGSYQTFPYSMEWFYLPLRDVMTGPQQFRWDALERQLNDIAARGHQAVFRFYVDYPGKPTGIPQYLLDQGLRHPPVRRIRQQRRQRLARLQRPAPGRGAGELHHRARPPLRRRPAHRVPHPRPDRLLGRVAHLALRRVDQAGELDAQHRRSSPAS